MASKKTSQQTGDLFEGFADQDGKFFKALAKNQNKEWFTRHKSEFEEGWSGPMKALMAELSLKLESAYPDCDLGEPKAFRIYRDVRFSKDKTPYKTHVSGFIPLKAGASPMESPAAIYFQVGTETFAAAGQWGMSKQALDRYRAAIIDDASGKELGRFLASLEKKGFVRGAMEVMKRVPRGFEPEHPRADLLRHKGLVVTFPPLDKKLLTSRKLVDALVKQSKLVAPFVRWLAFATA